MKNDSIPKLTGICGECRKEKIKVFRVYRGKNYCGTCYARLFKKSLCPKCSNYARLPIFDSKGVCINCYKDRPCARCGKENYSTGKITSYGPVCCSCANFIRLKTQPAKSPTNRSRASFGTCKMCHRHRVLEKTSNGRIGCKKCLHEGEVACQQCGALMPAGRGKQCESCYRKNLLERRIKVSLATFSQAPMGNIFKNFSEWLGTSIGYHKAAITLNKYLPFFLDIEIQWKFIPEYNQLLNHFGSLALRRVLLPMKWMQMTGLISVDENLKEAHVESRRIMGILNRLREETSERQILNLYHKFMMERHQQGRNSLRSVRLSLHPASQILLKALEKKVS